MHHHGTLGTTLTIHLNLIHYAANSFYLEIIKLFDKELGVYYDDMVDWCRPIEFGNGYQPIKSGG